jgi:chemotaxis regulatin CheY-phosphate phosphatase CheZ
MSGEWGNDLLCDSDALLPLVETAIHELGDLQSAEASTLALRLRTALDFHRNTAPAGHIVLTELLERGQGEIRSVLDSLAQSRHLLQRTAVAKIHRTQDKLREVSSATESAATDVLDGIERATEMVDALDAIAARASEPDKRAAQLRNLLRDELFALMGHMQFQDIASQQLNHAASILEDMETRLASIARVFDPKQLSAQERAAIGKPPIANAVAFDPGATTKDASERQALADSVLMRATT